MWTSVTMHPLNGGIHPKRMTDDICVQPETRRHSDLLQTDTFQSYQSYLLSFFIKLRNFCTTIVAIDTCINLADCFSEKTVTSTARPASTSRTDDVRPGGRVGSSDRGVPWLDLVARLPPPAGGAGNHLAEISMDSQSCGGEAKASQGLFHHQV